MSKFRNLTVNILYKNGVFLENINADLIEAKAVGDLYHATTPASLRQILKDDFLSADSMSTGNSGGISSTRDRKLWYRQGVQLILDGDKLSNRHKITPYSNFSDGDHIENVKVFNNPAYNKIEREEVILPRGKGAVVADPYYDPAEVGPGKKKQQYDYEYYLKDIKSYIKGIIVHPTISDSPKWKNFMEWLLSLPYPIYDDNMQRITKKNLDNRYINNQALDSKIIKNPSPKEYERFKNNTQNGSVLGVVYRDDIYVCDASLETEHSFHDRVQVLIPDLGRWEHPKQTFKDDPQNGLHIPSWETLKVPQLSKLASYKKRPNLLKATIDRFKNK